MSAGLYNFTAHQGATFAQTLTYRDSAAALVNLTGCTARMQLRESYAASAAALALTTENGRITLGGTGGTIALLIAASDMAALSVPDTPGYPPEKVFFYDLEIVSAGGIVTALLYGSFTVRREVTR